jgi:drug/metabolite transporter (DMT)-like permease
MLSRYHPFVLFFAVVGVVVVAYSAEKTLFGNDCCSGKNWQAHTAAYKLGLISSLLFSLQNVY